MQDKHLKYALVIPAALVVFVTAIYPLARSLWISFHDWRLNKSSTIGPYVGIENYTWALEDEDFLNSVWVTLNFTFWSVTLTVLLSMGMALLLYKGGFFRTTVRTLLVLPFAMSPALVGVSWRFMFNPEFGLFEALLSGSLPWLADIAWLSDPFWANVVLIASDVWNWAPFFTMVYIGGLGAIPHEAQEAARTDGASEWQVFRDVTLPLWMPVIMIGVVLKTIFSLKMFDQVYMLTNGGPGNSTQTLGHFIYFNGFKYYDMGYASAVSYMLVIPMIVLAFIYVRMVFRSV